MEGDLVLGVGVYALCGATRGAGVSASFIRWAEMRRLYARNLYRRSARLGRADRTGLTNDVDLASVRPGLSVAKRPVRGPDAAAVGHGEDVRDEQAAFVRLLRADTDRVALAPNGDAIGVVDGNDDRVVGLDIGELLGGAARDVVDEAVRGVGVGEEVPATEKTRYGVSDGLIRGAQVSKASRHRGGAGLGRSDEAFNLFLLSSRLVDTSVATPTLAERREASLPEKPLQRAQRRSGRGGDVHSSHTRAVTLSGLCGARADRKKQGHSLKEVLARVLIHKLVGSTPGGKGRVLADGVVTTELGAVVGRQSSCGCSERKNEGSESANHCVVRVSRWG